MSFMNECLIINISIGIETTSVSLSFSTFYSNFSNF